MFWFINGSENSQIESKQFTRVQDARKAWEEAGSPKIKGSSVWASLYDPKTLDTIKTVTFTK